MRVVIALVVFLLGTALVGVGVGAIVTFGTEGRLDLESSRLSSSTDSRAIVVDIEQIEVGVPAGDSIGEVTLGVVSATSDPVFIGLGSTEAVNDYLGTSSFDAARLSSGKWELVEIPGAGSPEPPGQETFWTRRGQGINPELTYRAAPGGETTFAVMNPDASTGITVQVVVAYRSSVIFPAAVAAVVVGALLIILSIVLLMRRRRSGREDGSPEEDASKGAGSGSGSVDQQATGIESWLSEDGSRSADSEERR